jgi:hypothetical protein
MSNTNFPARLVEAAASKTLVPFVGAGVPMSICRKDGSRLFPSWKELLQYGAERLDEEQKAREANVVRALVDVDSYLEAAKHLKKGLGGLFGPWIQKLVGPSSAEADPATYELTRAIWQLGSRLVLTTNYDHTLRWAAPEGMQSDLVEWSKIPQRASSSMTRHPTVWHLHGLIDDPADLVLSSDDYSNIYDSNSPEAQRFKQELKNLLTDRAILFIGFSMDDHHLQMELNWLQSCYSLIGGRHFMMISSDRFAETERRLAALKESIQLVSYERHGAPLILALRSLNPTKSDKVEPQDSSPGAIAEQLPRSAIPPATTARPVLIDSLTVLIEAIRAVRIPGLDSSIPLHTIWNQPSFVVDEGEVPLHKILARRTVAILAPAGFGKTTISKMIALCLAQDFLQGVVPPIQGWSETHLGVKPGLVPHFPVLIDLRNLKMGGDPESIFASSTPIFNDNERSQLAPLLKDGNVAFIFDGLDEIDNALRLRAVELISRARLKWGKCYFIVTSRQYDNGSFLDGAFALARISSPTPATTNALIDKWSAAVLANEKRDAFALVAKRFIDEQRAVGTFISSPLVIAFLASTYRIHGELPSSAALLFSSISDWLLESRSHVRSQRGVDLDTTKRSLSSLALAITLGLLPSKAPIESIIRAVHAATALPPISIEEVVKLEASSANCLVYTGGSVSFWHESLREYFAARRLIDLFHEADPVLPTEVGEVLVKDDCRDVATMFVALLALDHPDDCKKLLYGLSHADPASADYIKLATAQSRALDVAMRHGIQLDPGKRKALLAEIDLRLSVDAGRLKSLSIGDRIETLNALGKLRRDPRLFGPPILRALPIRIDSEAVKAGNFPVTVQEYGRFVNAVPTGAPVKTRHVPLEWERQLETPNVPVTGVSCMPLPLVQATAT